MLRKKIRESNFTGNDSSTLFISKMTTCTHCGPEPPPVKIQNITLWDEGKERVFENNSSEIPPANPIQDIKEDANKVLAILDKTLYFSDAKKISNEHNRTKRSFPRKKEVAASSKSSAVTGPILLSKFDGGKISIIPLDIDSSDSNLMTQAIMRDQAREDSPRLERVAQIVTNIVHSPRALSYGRVTYPYDSSLTSTRQSNQPYGVPHNKLIIRPTRYRSQYRFPPEPSFYSGNPQSSDYYSGVSSPQKQRKGKKLPAKLIDVHENHDSQYEYVEMDVNHEGKQVPRKPPKYMRGRYKGHSPGGYNSYKDYYKKPSSGPNKKGSSKAYHAPKDTYGYEEEHDRGEGYDYHDALDHKRSPDYEESTEEGEFPSQEDRGDHSSAEGFNGPNLMDSPLYDAFGQKSKKSNFVPSQPFPTRQKYNPPFESPGKPPHKFIPVPKTLEEYHQLHGTKFLNSYRPEEDDEFTFHYPNGKPDDGQYDEEESANPSFNPPKYFREAEKPAFQEYGKHRFQEYHKPSSSGFQDTKTPTSFMSVTYGKPDFEADAQTRIRDTIPGRKSKYSQPLHNTNSETYDSGAASNDELSSKELHTFLDQVKSQVYDEDGNLKSDFKSDLKSDLKSSNFDASIDPFSSYNSRKKAKKGSNSNTKDLLENARGNYNKKNNYRNKNSYFTSGNSNVNFNNRNTFSNKKYGWKGDGDTGFGYKGSNHQDSFDRGLFDKDGVPSGFKRDLFGKDRMKSLVPSESNQQVSERENPGRRSRRVKIKVTKTNQILEENETLVKPIVANNGVRTTTETNFANTTATNRNATTN